MNQQDSQIHIWVVVADTAETYLAPGPKDREALFGSAQPGSSREGRHQWKEPFMMETPETPGTPEPGTDQPEAPEEGGGESPETPEQGGGEAEAPAS